MWNIIKAYCNGLREFRSAVTTHYDDLGLSDAYDAGRDRAHALTLRHWDN